MFNTFFMPYQNWNNRMLSKRFPLCKLPHIVKLSTVAVTTDTAGTNVTYLICPWRWKQLPKEGMILLQVNHSPAAGSDAFTVSIATSSTNTETTTTTAVPLVNGSGDQVTSAEIIQGNRYLLYYNKCEGTFQIVNYIPAATT